MIDEPDPSMNVKPLFASHILVVAGSLMDGCLWSLGSAVNVPKLLRLACSNHHVLRFYHRELFVHSAPNFTRLPDRRNPLFSAGLR